jgi:hypothetical protein
MRKERVITPSLHRLKSRDPFFEFRLTPTSSPYALPSHFARRIALSVLPGIPIPFGMGKDAREGMVPANTCFMNPSVKQKNAGRITQIIGPVLDVAFSPGKMPNIFNALSISGKMRLESSCH